MFAARPVHAWTDRQILLGVAAAGFGLLGQLLFAPDASATIFKVGAAGAPTYHFTTIQKALDSTATTGHTILVSAGTYRDSVPIVSPSAGKDATQGSPTILLADGEVVIDCGDPFVDSVWTQHSGEVYKATRSKALMVKPVDGDPIGCLVHVGEDRYDFTDTAYVTMSRGYWAYDTLSQTVYVRFRDGTGPAGKQIFITDKRKTQGIRIRRSDFFRIKGFTVKRSAGAGILVDGNTAAARDREPTVDSCFVSQCWGPGIQLSWTGSGSVTRNVTHGNGSHGIQVIRSDSAMVTGNTSYDNDDPMHPRGGANGIRIGRGAGSGADTAQTAFTKVDYNRTYGNEDTGIELNGTRWTVVRRNLIYANEDHGVDNLTTNQAAYINNVIFSNDHNGLSAENGVSNVQAYNNIFLHNARTVATLGNPQADISEMDLKDSTGFRSNHNVIKALPGTDIPNEGGTVDRHVVDVPNGGANSFFDNFALYVEKTGLDAQSDSTIPALDTLNYVFTLNGTGTTYAVDAAKTNITGWWNPMWIPADPTSPYFIEPHNSKKTDIGIAGAGTGYTDIGAFEFDARPGQTNGLAMDLDDCDSNHVQQWFVTWTAVSDDSLNELPLDQVAEYDVRTSTSESITEGNWNNPAIVGSFGGPTPLDPGTGSPPVIQRLAVQLPGTRYFGLKARDANGHWSALSNVIQMTPPDPSEFDCGGKWYGGGGGGGGGCCHEEGFRGPSASSLQRSGDGGGRDTIAAGENTIFNGTPTGTRGSDLLPIDAVQNEEGLYLAHLRVTRRYGGLVDGVKLLFVDHPLGTEAFACGSTVVVGRRSHASQAVTHTGDDATKPLSGIGGIFNGSAGVAVTISTPLDAQETPLVIECSNGGVRGSTIIVESQSSSGWREVGVIRPRRASSAGVLNSMPAGPIRLRFNGYAKVTSVARLAQETNATTTSGSLESARTSSEGDVLSAIGAEDTLATELIAPDTLVASFSGPPAGRNVVRSLFLGIAATPVTASAATSHAAARQSSLPTQFALYQNAPNPFWGSTAIRLDLPVGRMVKLEIFDVTGRRVRTLVNRFMPAGRQSVVWDQRDDAGAAVGAGVYFSRLQVDTFRDRKKLTLIP